MPVYDYQCNECLEIFDVEHGMQEKIFCILCPTCGSGDTRRVFIRAPALRVWWRNAAASSDAESMRPRFSASVVNKKAAEALGGQ